MSFVSVSMNPATNGNPMRSEIERLLQEVAPLRATAWAPAANGYEDPNGFTMEFDVPGFTPDQLDVTAQDGQLIVRGTREARENANEVRVLFVERPMRSFERRIRLPKSADVANITASHSHGVLTVRVAKLAVVAPRKIAINSGDAVATPSASN